MNAEQIGELLLSLWCVRTEFFLSELDVLTSVDFGL